MAQRRIVSTIKILRRSRMPLSAQLPGKAPLVAPAISRVIRVSG
jgi:hypothetical protein